MMNTNINLDVALSSLPGVGPAYARKLRELGLISTRDLLFYFPFRYDNFAKLKSVRDAGIGETISVTGVVLDIKNIRTFRKKMLITEAIVADETGTIKAVWFNQPFLTRNIGKNQKVCLSGKTSYGEDGLVFSNPSYEVIYENSPLANLAHTARLVPVYHESFGVSSRYLRSHILPLLPLAQKVKDHLPLALKKKYDLADIGQALKEIHFPESEELIEKARSRLAFDELFLIELFVLKSKIDSKKSGAVSIKFTDKTKIIVQKFVESLPFKLTDGQKIASWEIIKDISRPEPMNRLLEGDVGSGKTLVAIISAIVTVKAGYQTALMAPTEILAEQHFDKIGRLLKGLGIKIGLITGSKSMVFNVNKKEEAEEISRAKFLAKAAQGEINFIIGTHSLIAQKIAFKNLALVIVDEQHRFGVGQRAALQNKAAKVKDGIKSANPHFLSMTATPIPRTLALTVYGDLDISILKEMPSERLKIITKIVAPANRDKAYQFIRQEIKKARQAFVICPLIEESEALEAKSAIEEHRKLSVEIFPDLKIGLLHGRMKPDEKEKTMRDFLAKKIDILVTTSVVEVGIDVPNATVMMIEGADRFGLAQLYQFRGRVGRGSWQSYCLLFTDSPAKATHKRLKAIVEAKNGFELAEKDLEIRGPGEFYGVRQSGLPNLVMAKFTDAELIKECREAAKRILKEDPDLKKYPLLKSKLKEFSSKAHLE